MFEQLVRSCLNEFKSPTDVEFLVLLFNIRVITKSSLNFRVCLPYISYSYFSDE